MAAPQPDPETLARIEALAAMTRDELQATSAPGEDKEVQQPITLVLPVSPDRIDELKNTLRGLPAADLKMALDMVGTVHFTRFVVLEDARHGSAQLIVAATFDGPLDEYIRVFARVLSAQFDALLSFAEDRPEVFATASVALHADAFVQYCVEHNVPPVSGASYGGYPDLTALDIYEAARARHPAPPALTPWP